MDILTYDRPTKQTPAYGGFELREKPPSAILVHSTSNPHQRNTAFSAEADFLFKSNLAGAHYLVGKDGRIVRFFEPLKWAAWHAGRALGPWQNQKSIGIELHHSVGDDFYPQAQLLSLAALLRQLMAQFGIAATMIETHGQAAIPGPYSRKTDPSDWPYEDFRAWRDRNLVQPPPRPMGSKVQGLPVYQRSDRTGPLWGYLKEGERVVVDENGHLADGRGFVDVNGLQGAE